MDKTKFKRAKLSKKNKTTQKTTPKIPKIWVKFCGVRFFLKNNILNGVCGCRIS